MLKKYKVYKYKMYPLVNTIHVYAIGYILFIFYYFTSSQIILFVFAKPLNTVEEAEV